jgi:N-acyl-D-amino-acid deacylase
MLWAPELRRLAVWATVVLWAASPLEGQRVRPTGTADLLLAGGTIVDGSGSGPRRADVAITAGRITAVGDLKGWEPRERVDVSGLTVAPGFIDVHTHADRVADTPLAENFVRMGVTTVVAGNCGGSPVDVGTALQHIERTGVSVNFATLVGHNSVRQRVLGTERRAPTPEELQRMRDFVALAMADGAVGLSTGLEYVPGSYAQTDEIIALAKVAAAWGGLYASHMRDEGPKVDEAIAETIAVGEAAACPVQISHLKIDSPSVWGRAPGLLALIDRARARGVRVRADQYAYTASSTGLGIRFPGWALEGGEAAVSARLADADTWTRIKSEMRGLLERKGAPDYAFAVVASYASDPSRNGLSIAEIARRTRNDASLDAQLEVMREMLQAGGAQMVYHVMGEEDVRRIMRHPHVAVASDASVNTPGVGRPHPRGYGNTARVLAKYVREEGVLSLGEAVRKMSALPAEHFGFTDRGLLRPGSAADLVVFDPRAISDRATFEAPHAFPDGMPHVLVNGVFVVRNGTHTGMRPGAVIRSRRPANAPAPGSESRTPNATLRRIS